MSDSNTTTSWKDRAAELEQYGTPPVRAKVVALREEGLSYAQIAGLLEFGEHNNDKSQVARHLDAYKGQYREAQKLLEEGPKPEISR